MQDVPWTDARQLIRIAHYDQNGSLRKRGEEAIHKAYVHHGRLVKHEHVPGQGILRIIGESTRLRIVLQKTMDRLGWRTCRFRKAFRRPTGRSGCLHGDEGLSLRVFAGAIDVHKGADYRGLSDTGTACYYAHLVFEGGTNGALLCRGKTETALSFPPRYRLLRIYRIEGSCGRYQTFHLPRNAPFRPVELRKIYAAHPFFGII